MATVEKAIEVHVPVNTAYNQWTQFEEFPRFMEGVTSVHQVDDQHLRWQAEIAGEHKEWDARITQQVPDQVIAWQSESGATNAGVVSFKPLDNGMTEVHLRLDYEPEGMKEGIGDVLGFVGRQVDSDLQRFKEFIENRGSETGAWRGEIHGGTSTEGSTGGGIYGQSGYRESTTPMNDGRDLDSGGADREGTNYGGTRPEGMAGPTV